MKKLASGRSCSVRLAQRSSIVLLAANGLENLEIAEKLGIEGVAVNTDDHPLLEFRAARNLLLGDLSLRERREANRLSADRD
ncbi:MAG: hypothetical protein GY835_18725 [bacterium]|nr:hypothetical protein [bacterium]